MNKSAEGRRREIEALTEAPPGALFLRPIDYIFADHFRHRTLCKVLEELAEETDPDREKLNAALHFLQADFSTHVEDEEENLFPLLLERAAPEDGIEDVLTELSRDHARDMKDVRQIVKILADWLKASDDQALSAGDRNRLQTFARREKHHLTLENAIVLPLARARLPRDDLCTIGKHMASRRGVAYPEEGHAL